MLTEDEAAALFVVFIIFAAYIAFPT